MMKLKAKYKMISILNEIKNNNTKAIVFLRGFPAAYYKIPNDCGYEYIGNETWLNNKGYVDVKALDADRNLLQNKFFSNEPRYLWGYYEEFIKLATLLNDIKIQYDGRILIIDNNLFDSHYPLDVEDDVLTKLYDYFTNESSDDDISAYLNYYSDVEIYQDGSFGISFINKHQDENIEVLPFYETRLDIKIDEKSMYDFKIAAKDPNLFCLKNLLQKGEKKILLG